MAPTLETFKARFPSFSAANETIQLFLDEAALEVGAEWIERDRDPAILYLAAHLMASEGVGVPGPVEGGVALYGPLTSYKVGDVSATFAGAASAGGSASRSIYASTVYGQRFLALKRRNFPTVAVV